MDTTGIFGKVPISVNTDKRLKGNDLKVYVALASFAGNKGECWPSRRSIAERSGVDISHISKHTHKLEDCGHIQIIQRGKRISNTYIIGGLEVEMAQALSNIPPASIMESSKSAHSPSMNPPMGRREDVVIAQGGVATSAQGERATSAQCEDARPAHSNNIRSVKRSLERPLEKTIVFSFLELWQSKYKSSLGADYRLFPEDPSLIEELETLDGESRAILPAAIEKFIGQGGPYCEADTPTINEFYSELELLIREHARRGSIGGRN